MPSTLRGVRAPAKTRLQAVELAQAYRDRGVLELVRALLDMAPDAERVGESLSVRAGVIADGVWQLDIRGARSNTLHGSVRVSDDPCDIQAAAAALRVSVNGRARADVGELDRLNVLLGQDGWTCERCGQGFSLFADCDAHERGCSV